MHWSLNCPRRRSAKSLDAATKRIARRCNGAKGLREEWQKTPYLKANSGNLDGKWIGKKKRRHTEI